VRFALLETSTRRGPQRFRRELEAHEQDAVVGIEHDRARRLADPELTHG
jgi:hypothetical protein